MKNIRLSKKQLLILAPVIMVVLVGGAFALSSLNTPTPTTDESQDTSSEVETMQNTPSPEDDPNISTDEEKKAPIQYEGESPNSSNSLTGVINFKSVVNDNLVIRITIDQAIREGSCRLMLVRTNDNKSVTKDATIIQNPSSSSCEGFDIPIAELGGGNWSIEVQLTDGTRSGIIKESIDI